MGTAITMMTRPDVKATRRDPEDPDAYPLNTANRTYDKKDPTGNIIGTYNLPDCLNDDDDLDRLPDAWEDIWGGLIGVGSKNNDYDGDGTPDGDEDFDQDGLTNLEEYQNRTDPTMADTDGDGVNDGAEIANGTDPTNPQLSGFTDYACGCNRITPYTQTGCPHTGKRSR